MSAVDRARQALADYAAGVRSATSALGTLRDLLAEIDAGHWIDTREIAALGDVTIYYNASYQTTPWEVLDFDRSWEADTLADAVRAARDEAAE